MPRIRLRPEKTRRRWIGATFVLVAVFVAIKALELAGVIRP